MADAGEQPSPGFGSTRDGEDGAALPTCPCGSHAATPENPSGVSALPPPPSIRAELEHGEEHTVYLVGDNGETYRIVRTLADCIMGKVRYEECAIEYSFSSGHCRSVCCCLGYHIMSLPGKTGGSL